MKIFIDSADVAEIRKAARTGLLDGCTTNPTLLMKAGRKIEEAIPEICEIVGGPVSAEVLSQEHDAIVKEARVLAKLHPNVVVKVPLVVDGLRAVQTLKKEGIRTNVTLCFSATQALLAAKAGAAYISPFLGRVDDMGSDGTDLLRDIVAIYDRFDFDTEVLAASIRSTLHVVQAATLGADVATIPLSVFEQMWKHPLTDVGLAKFAADAQKAHASK